MDSLLPAAASPEAFDRVRRVEAVLRPGVEAICARHRGVLRGAETKKSSAPEQTLVADRASSELDRVLEIDPRIRTGKLANGLTYYVLEHPKPRQGPSCGSASTPDRSRRTPTNRASLTSSSTWRSTGPRSSRRWRSLTTSRASA